MSGCLRRLGWGASSSLLASLLAKQVYAGCIEEDVLKEADVVSLHCLLDKSTTHLINKERLSMMKKDALLINAARGPIVDEVALVNHLKANPELRCGLDVFEDEPAMKPGLADCPNAVIVPHIASASMWTRSGMATLAAANVAGRLMGHPVWPQPNNIAPFLDRPMNSFPAACPSIVNAKELGLPTGSEA
ncbi:D-isomer specific 2-hydroxyacid dehydrogenase [Dunaliella salina]|uniref:D-isomer specific 2-hydroxyacid dehydrogenase n=1 Tax=Dunaliella salina TaxID=3046 RepID=A0ABQ7GYW7_DUNSA|nr:D-isomer specific 2-hydroxyacid dehydrogenase [Dunaliella salina]|eukprot:KAF5839798.1 D-isomer specific 2-hydroxyacid dehydrogenase [Dunaliella salina]